MNADPRRLAPRSLRPRLCAVETKPEPRGRALTCGQPGGSAGSEAAAAHGVGTEASSSRWAPQPVAWLRLGPDRGAPRPAATPSGEQGGRPACAHCAGDLGAWPRPWPSFDLCDRLPPHFCDHCKQAMRLRFGRLSIKFEVRRPAGGGWAGLHTAPLTRVPPRSPLVPRRPGPGRGVSRDAGGGENDRKADGQAPTKVGGPTDTALTIRGTRRPRSGGTNPAMHKTGRLRPGEGGGSARGAAW